MEKFIGDAVMAVFGAPVVHEDDPERAVHAALAIRDAVAELNRAEPDLDLHVRIGITTGEALVTLGARTSKGEGMVAGDIVNAQLELVLDFYIAVGAHEYVSRATALLAATA